MDHKRFIVVGRAGSGKSVMMRYIGMKSPRCLYINTQHNPMREPWACLQADIGADTFPLDELFSARSHIFYNPPIGFNMDAFMSRWYAWAMSHNGCMLMVDECSFWGLRGKLAMPPWAVTAVTRSRLAFHVVLSNHSLYQIPTMFLSNVDYIIMFDTGQGMQQERAYLADHFEPVTTQENRQWLIRPYHFILYEARRDAYFRFSPIREF